MRGLVWLLGWVLVALGVLYYWLALAASAGRNRFTSEDEITQCLPLVVVALGAIVVALAMDRPANPDRPDGCL